MLARYVHGPGMDQPLVRYDGSGTTNKVSLHADERGSITTLSYGSPYAPIINRYDEYGKPQPTNVGRFQYTGQAWLGEVGAYYYKARVYSPAFGGRFLQTDPINIEGGINLYAYVGNDPISWVDSLGLIECPTGSVAIFRPISHGPTEPGVVVAGGRYFCQRLAGDSGASSSPSGPGSPGKGAPKPKPRKLTPCQQAAIEKGPIAIDFGNVSVFAGIGGTFSVGVFVNLRTGTKGFFYTAGGGWGLQAGAGLQGGVYGSITDLIGFNWSLSASGGVSGSINFSKEGRIVGGSAGGGAKVGGSFAATETGLFLCQIAG
jgi:RHS repeat-associated protein